VTVRLVAMCSVRYIDTLPSESDVDTCSKGPINIEAAFAESLEEVGASCRQAFPAESLVVEVAESRLAGCRSAYWEVEAASPSACQDVACLPSAWAYLAG
jgi:hypothetical protein